MDQNLKEIIHGKSHLQIGKGGLSQGVIGEIIQLFKKNRYLKVRFLDRGEFDTIEQAIESLINLVKAKAVDKRGNTVVLRKMSKK
jgi:RNA-binding protein YhbY